MNIVERRKIIDYFTRLENQGEVYKWRIYDVDAWPIIKTAVFLYLFNLQNNAEEVEKKQHSNKTSRWKNSLALIKAYWVQFILLRKRPDAIFSGARGHRIMVKEESINRYFDPLLDILEEHNGNGLMLEYDSAFQLERYKSSRVYDIYELLPIYKRATKENNEWKGLFELESFESFIQDIESNFGLASEVTKGIIISKMKLTLAWKALWAKLFSHWRPKIAMLLCYYLPAGYGMILAAREVGVKVVDMQHGGQGRLHTAYWFKEMPFQLNTLPDFFWLWNQSSNNQIAIWSSGFYTPILGGNPWGILSERYLDEIFKSEDNRPIILVSLQLTTPLLSGNLISTIQSTSDRYQWWLRMHPRTSETEIEVLNDLLTSNEIDQLVNISDATKLSLPTLFQHIHLHMSMYSGTLIESLEVGVPTLVIDPIGAEMFDEDSRRNDLLFFHDPQECPNGLVKKMTEALNVAEHKKKVPFESNKLSMVNTFFSFIEEKQINQV
jgi:hypothetical protein